VPEPTFTSPLLAEDSTTLKASAVLRPAKDVVPAQPSKHRRSQTENELAMAPADSDDSPSPVLLHPPPDRTTSVRVSTRQSPPRHAHAAAPMFEVKGKVDERTDEEIKEVTCSQRRPKRSDRIGDGWLKVFSQSLTGKSGWCSL